MALTLNYGHQNNDRIMDNTKTITHLSLCSGYEGIGLGLRRVLPNLREIAYVEREGFPIANLVAKMQEGVLDAAPVFTDVKTFPYGKFRGLVDILSGGFPCQPFSSAGKREGVEDPRHLFPYIRDGIAQCRPRLVFLENVEGIISSKTADGESVLKYVLGELEGLGYRATAGVFSASEVGAPHQRKRVFILGYARSSEPSGIPSEQREKVSETRESSDELAYAESLQSRLKTERQGRQDSSGGSEELGNAECTRLEGHTGTVQETSRWHQPLRPVAPPSFQQHEWEQPRTQPKLGRTAHGSSSRVDRLRLLGNGVVPATAAKAFVTLLNKLP
jgi:DNA (cytosine-5)-methyltransferase 1